MSSVALKSQTTIKNNSKLFCGVGCNSGGKHKTSKDGKHTKAYVTWHSMLRRCYHTVHTPRGSAYIGCSVSDEWLDFQNFAEWYVNHEYSDKGYALDKDLLIPNNKIYSPETCCFVPPELNNLLNDRRALRGKYPQGVTYHVRDNNYKSCLNIRGKQKHLGYFDCIQEAHGVYVAAKEAYVKDIALEWQDRIADDVFQALMNWRFVE